MFVLFFTPALLVLVHALQENRIVYPSIIEGRSLDDKKIVRINEHLALHLTKSSFIADELDVSLTQDGKEVKQTLSGEKISEWLHVDRERFAALSLEQTDGFVRMRGLVNATHSIHPLAVMGRSRGGPMPHAVRVVERSRYPGPMHSIGEKPGPMHSIGDDDPKWFEKVLMDQAWNHKVHNWPKDEWSNVILKTIIIAEAKLLEQIFHGPFFDDPITYLILVTASVGLRLSALEYPGIQLKLTGVYSAPDHIEKLMREQTPETLPVKRASKNLVMKGTLGSPHYRSDVALFLTQFDLTEAKVLGNNANLNGFSVLGGLCTLEKYVYVRDNGRYQGVEPAALWTSRVLGAEFDGFEKAETCPADDGYFMGAGGIKLPYRFSDCSRSMILETMKQNSRPSQSLTCLRLTREEEIKDKHKKYMGEGVSPDEFCKSMHKMGEHCLKGQDVLPTTCKVKCCQVVDGKSESLGTHFAQDGMLCDSVFDTYNTGGICLNGYCHIRSKVRKE